MFRVTLPLSRHAELDSASQSFAILPRHAELDSASSYLVTLITMGGVSRGIKGS